MSREKRQPDNRSTTNGQDAKTTDSESKNPTLTPANISAALSKVLKKLSALKDKSGRFIAELFLTLPDRDDYPDYYSIINNPIAFDTFERKINSNEYLSVAEFLRDFDLLVQNASTYNKKGSLVVKDALLLKKTMEKFIQDELGANVLTSVADISTPSKSDKPSKSTQKVSSSVLTNILKKVSNIKEEGHRITVYFEELPDASEYPDYYKIITSPIALDKIEKKIAKGEYHAYDEFLKDIRQLCSNAFLYNEEGSLVYSHATKLQLEVERLLSEAHNLTDGEKIEAGKKLAEIEHKGMTLKVGDFVHIQNRLEPAKPIIALIYEIYETGNNDTGVEVCWFVRPENTVHRPSYKFMENEVFKANHHEHYMLNEIISRCHVLFYRDYIRGKPKGMKENEKLYVCESRYDEQGKNISKIKNWSACFPTSVRNIPLELELYDTPLTPAKFSSAFASNLPNSGTTTASSSRKASEDIPDELEVSRAAKRKRGSPKPKKEKIEKVRTPMVSTNASPTPSRTSTPSITIKPPPPPSQTLKAPVITSELNIPFNASAGHVKWFSTPPLDVVSADTTEHSLEYLFHKHSKKEITNSEEGKKAEPSLEVKGSLTLDTDVEMSDSKNVANQDPQNTRTPSWYYPLLDMKLPPAEYWAPHKQFFEHVAEIFLGEAYAMKN